MGRFQDFGIDLQEYLEKKPSWKGFIQLSDAVEKKFYSADDQWRAQLARLYKIDYFVMVKRKMNGVSHMHAAFENDRFLVLETRLGQPTDTSVLGEVGQH